MIGMSQFQKIFVVNLPERPDKLDAFTVASSVSGIRAEVLEGVHGQEISNKTLPSTDKLPVKASMRNNMIGCWRAHMNFARKCVLRLPRTDRARFNTLTNTLQNGYRVPLHRPSHGRRCRLVCLPQEPTHPLRPRLSIHHFVPRLILTRARFLLFCSIHHPQEKAPTPSLPVRLILGPHVARPLRQHSLPPPRHPPLPD